MTKFHYFQHFYLNSISLKSVRSVALIHRCFLLWGLFACIITCMEQLNSKTDLPSCRWGSLSGSHTLCYQTEDIGSTVLLRLSKTERNVVLFHLWKGKKMLSKIFGSDAASLYIAFPPFLHSFIKLVCTVFLLAVVLGNGMCVGVHVVISIGIF